MDTTFTKQDIEGVRVAEWNQNIVQWCLDLIQARCSVGEAGFQEGGGGGDLRLSWTTQHNRSLRSGQSAAECDLRKEQVQINPPMQGFCKTTYMSKVKRP
jgi:hypothetical protein